MSKEQYAHLEYGEWAYRELVDLMRNGIGVDEHLISDIINDVHQNDGQPERVAYFKEAYLEAVEANGPERHHSEDKYVRRCLTNCFIRRLVKEEKHQKKFKTGIMHEAEARDFLERLIPNEAVPVAKPINDGWQPHDEGDSNPARLIAVERTGMIREKALAALAAHEVDYWQFLELIEEYDTIDMMLWMRGCGNTYQTIAEVIGFSESTVRRRVKPYEAELRERTAERLQEMEEHPGDSDDPAYQKHAPRLVYPDENYDDAMLEVDARLRQGGNATKPGGAG